jgi:peptidyl-prolyl cis-trans isomerase B (cyclophilin B)
MKQLQGEASSTPMPEQRAGDLPPAERNDMFSAPPPLTIDPNRSYKATIVTQKGNIVVDLAAADAPETVNNFVYLAGQGFYDGLTFHRVENQPQFSLIQGGDPTGTGRGGPGYTIPAEIGLPHDEGAIAMARLGDQVNPERASSGSQFYICLVPIHQLDGSYTVFGYVTEGLDVAKEIAVGDEILTIVIAEE